MYRNFPVEGEIYDYYLSFKTNQFRNWSELIPEFEFQNEQPFFKINVPNINTVRMTSLIIAITQNNLNCLVLGDVGVGKTQLINQHLKNLDSHKFISSKVSFSP
jgi:dynein heavy chain